MNVYTAQVRNGPMVRLMVVDPDGFASATEDDVVVAYTMEDEERILNVRKGDLLNLKAAE